MLTQPVSGPRVPCMHATHGMTLRLYVPCRSNATPMQCRCNPKLPHAVLRLSRPMWLMRPNRHMWSHAHLLLRRLLGVRCRMWWLPLLLLHMPLPMCFPLYAPLAPPPSISTLLVISHLQHHSVANTVRATIKKLSNISARTTGFSQMPIPHL